MYNQLSMHVLEPSQLENRQLIPTVYKKKNIDSGRSAIFSSKVNETNTLLSLTE